MTSPASTGGSGALFEAQVGAYYLLSMLLELDAWGLPNCRIESIRLQRGREGHPLDDVIIESQDHSGKTAILEIQVKRSITFAPSDEIFQDVVKQVRDAMDRPGFWTNHHHLAVGTARTTQKVTAYQDVLSWAQNIEDATTFHARLNRQGEASDAMRSFVLTFRKNLIDAGTFGDDEMVWKILRRFHIMIFDFTAPDSASVELMHERALRALEHGGLDEARNLWSRLTGLALEISTSAGHRSRAGLIADLASFQLTPSRKNRKALASIAEGSQSALSDINDEVSGVKLMRQRRVDAVRDAMTRSRYVEIRGEPGVGKSGVLRRLAEDLNRDGQVLVLSPNRVFERGWLSMKTAIGYDGTGRDLMAEMSLSGAAILFIDNLDFFRAEEQTTVRDIVRFASQTPNIWVVVTARVDFAKSEPSWLPNDALSSLGQTDPVLIDELDKAEVDELKEGAQMLSQLLSDSHPARAIVRNLFRLSRLANRPDDDPWPATEAEMAKQWWDMADGRNDAVLRERTRLLRRLTEQSLTSTQPYDASAENAQALDQMVASGTLRDYGSDRVTFRHDVLREWAIANLIFGERGFSSRFSLDERTTPDTARGAELAARIALEQTGGFTLWQQVLASVTNAHETWRRAVLLALVRSELSFKILATEGSALLEHDAALFKDLARYVTAVEFEPAAERLRARGLNPEGIPPDLRVPRNSSSSHLAGWLVLLQANVPASAVPDAIKVFSAHLVGTFGRDYLAPAILRNLYQWLQLIEDDREVNPYKLVNRVFGGVIPEYQLEILEAELRIAFLSFCHRVPEYAGRYLEAFTARQHADETRISILKFRGALAQAAPRQLADFTIDTIIGTGKSRSRRRTNILPEEPFEHVDLKFLPASPSQGPFLDLLLHCHEEGLRLVRRIVSYAVQFYRVDERDDHATVVYFNECGVIFPWPDFYYWSRDSGNAPHLVTSALMALEAWAHKRVQEGDSIDAVVAQIVGDPAMSSAALLVAVDVVLSHKTEAISAAIPLVACPELLCMDRLRLTRDNMVIPDFFGLKSLRQEPVGPATLDSLKTRASRKRSLYDMLCQLTFGPNDVVDKVRSLLLRAVTRLGVPDERSDLGDPKLMALHALNVLNHENWRQVVVTGADGIEQTFLQYYPPEAEVKQLEPIQRKASPSLEESRQQFEILNALYVSQAPTLEFLARAAAWAKERTDIFENRPDFDQDGKFLTGVEAVVSAATLLSRYGTAEQLAEGGAWMRAVFARVHEGSSEPVYAVREGLRFNPRAVAFVGQVLLLQRAPEDHDLRRLLGFASANGYASAHGFGASLTMLEETSPTLITAVLRCAFAAAVRLDLPWGLPEEEKEKNLAADEMRIQEQIDSELAWLRASRSEPEWPEFPIQMIRPRDHWRNGQRDYAAEAAEYNSVKHRVDYQRAALWLKQARPIFDPEARPWLRAVVSAYAEWTRQANGSGQEKGARYDGQPDDWNDVYFELAAECAGGLSTDGLERDLDRLFAELPDESFCDCLPSYLRSADQAFFAKKSLSIAQLIQIRTFFIHQLSATEVFGRNKDRDEARAEMHLARALAPLCFNVHSSLSPSRCYLPPALIPRADPFLPLLANLVTHFRSPFLATMYLNLIEVAPRAEQLPFITECVERWLERFPDSNRFWIEMSFGGRLCSSLIVVFHASPEAFYPSEVRSRIDNILAHLINLGVGQAHELERLMYQRHFKSGF
jgi:hypothetical protein